MGNVRSGNRPHGNEEYLSGTVFLLLYFGFRTDKFFEDFFLFAFIFWLKFYHGSLNSIFILPLFYFSRGGCCDYYDQRFVFTFFLIPTYIFYQKDDPIDVYSVIFCRSIDGKNQKFYSLFLILFIYQQENQESKRLWILPGFYMSKNHEDTFIMFLPTLTIYYKTTKDYFVSIAFLMLGYLKLDDFKMNWILPLYFHYSNKSDKSIYH